MCIRDSYNKFLLAYEQRYFFGKEDDGPVLEVPGSRTRKQVRTDDRADLPGREYSSLNMLAPENNTGYTVSLKTALETWYAKREPTEEVAYIKRYKVTPNVSEIRRIMLAFESRLPEELTFALNALLIYSCNTSTPFLLDSYPTLLDTITIYLEEALKNVPYLRRGVPKNALEHQNHDLGRFPTDAGTQSIAAGITADIKQGILGKYEPYGEASLLVHVRIIVQILRNLSFSKPNEIALFRHERVSKILLQVFLEGIDFELTHTLLDLVSNFCRSLNLKALPEGQSSSLLTTIIRFFSSESTEEIEAAIDCLRHLSLTSENESFLETALPTYLSTLAKLLIYPCLLYTSPSPRDRQKSRMPSSA
eukprot:TRINITY_DN9469_c0_g1_i1.p1 TRINITY_DN9469_c0_g1~~TRINITY_DN9469_c0_g1_i1.p1  ORF type:complete len:364 (+),score=71.90 TRINITY_DN9469_c0_g1_i1:64-1155(+)